MKNFFNNNPSLILFCSTLPLLVYPIISNITLLYPTLLSSPLSSLLHPNSILLEYTILFYPASFPCHILHPTPPFSIPLSTLPNDPMSPTIISLNQENNNMS